MRAFSKEEASMAGGFLLGMAVLFFAFSWLASLVPLSAIEGFYASASLAALKALGFNGWVTPGEPALVTLEALAQPIGITWLCTGLLELEILCAAILASSGIPLKKRVLGAIAAGAALAALNVLRITASVLAIIVLGLDAGSFSHDVLFRVFLFVAIAGLYYAWLEWAAK